MIREMPAGNIFIYCDDASHPKRVPVRNFYPAGDVWAELPATRHKSPSATTLVGDTVPDPRGLVGGVRSDDARRTRVRYELECRKCRERGAVPAREKKLFAVLNLLAAHGVSEISLSNLAASLARIDVSPGLPGIDAEPRQG